MQFLTTYIMLWVPQPEFDSWHGLRLSPHHWIQTGLGAYPAYYSMGTGAPFPSEKTAEDRAILHPHKA